MLHKKSLIYNTFEPTAAGPIPLVRERTRVLPRPAPPIFPPLGTKLRFQKRPLGVGEVHASDLLCFA